MKLLFIYILFFTFIQTKVNKYSFKNLEGDYEIISDNFNGVDYKRNCYTNNKNIGLSIYIQTSSDIQTQGKKKLENPNYLTYYELYPGNVGDTVSWFGFYPGGITSKDGKLKDTNEGIPCVHLAQRIKFDFNNQKIGFYAIKKIPNEITKDDYKCYWFNIKFQKDSILTLTSQINGHEKKVVLKKLKK